ncbi:MAG: hypothetical protein AB8G16_13880 [Gammaproteobacteria bacterium]
MRLGRFLLTFVFLSSPAVAHADTTLPEPVTNEELSVLIEAADALYQSGKYVEAYTAYRNELAPRGDAFGQYLTGYMLTHGQGVEKDPITGAAWMKLASDQGYLPLIRAKKKARKVLDGVAQQRSDDTYRELKQTYGDCALLAGRIEYLEEHVETITGSRIPENVSRVTVLYQFGPDLGFAQRQMRLREVLKAQRRAYRRECR